LIVIGPDGKLEAFNDPRVGPFNGDNTLVGVENDSSASVQRIFLDGGGEGLFAFDEDGLCSPESIGAPAGCPFGPTGYEGPGTRFVDVVKPNRSKGFVEFAGEGLAPGASTYFSLEWVDQLGCALETCYFVQPPKMKVTLSGDGRAGNQIVVPKNTPVSARATLSGLHSEDAGGEIRYGVYSDRACSHLVADAGAFTVSSGVAPASRAETLPPGSYFWQTTYSDSENGAVLSPCQLGVETVERDCTTARGVGHLGPRGSEGLHEANHLDISGRPHRFELKKPGMRVHLQALSHAACVGSHEFVGSGPATVDGVGGYALSFDIQATVGGVVLTAAVEKEGTMVFMLDDEKLSKPSREIFSADQ